MPLTFPWMKGMTSADQNRCSVPKARSEGPICRSQNQVAAIGAPAPEVLHRAHVARRSLEDELGRKVDDPERIAELERALDARLAAAT